MPLFQAKDGWVVPWREPAALCGVGNRRSDEFLISRLTGGFPDVSRRTRHLSCRHPHSVPDQHVAARRPRQTNLPRGRDRSRRDLAVEIHRGVLAGLSGGGPSRDNKKPRRWPGLLRDRNARAFSSEVDTGSREENASKKE